MRNALLKSIYVLLMLRTLVAMGFPTHTDTEKKDFLEEANIIEDNTVNDADASVKFYTCVHISPELENCNFSSYRKTTENSWLSGNRQMEKKKRELLSDNKENMLYSSMSVLGTQGRFPRQNPKKIIIYEIQRCVPHRLPFILPWCTEEDLADKKSETYRLIPFVRKGTSTAPLVLPDYDI